MSKPWMPLYVADYRNKTAHLSAAEHGAYLLLIMHYWVNGCLPDNADQLTRIAGMTGAEWKKSRSTLQAFFHDGWRHERIDIELARADDISCKRRAAADQRHSKRDANAHAIAEQTVPNSTHTRDVIVSSSLSFSEDSLESKEVSEEKTTRRKRKTSLPDDFNSDREIARKLGWAESRIDQQIQAFCDSALAHNRQYADWQAAWRNWCNSPFQNSQPARMAHETDRDRGKSEFKQALKALGEYAEGRTGGGSSETALRLLPAARRSE